MAKVRLLPEDSLLTLWFVNEGKTTALPGSLNSLHSISFPLNKINSPTDKRSHTLELTPKGKKIFIELRELKRKRYQKLIGNLTNEQVIFFNRILDKVTSNSEINLIK